MMNLVSSLPFSFAARGSEFPPAASRRSLASASSECMGGLRLTREVRFSTLHPPPSTPPPIPVLRLQGRSWNGNLGLCPGPAMGRIWSCPTRPPPRLTPIAGRRVFAAASSCVLAARQLIGCQRRACVPRLSRLSVSVSVPQRRQHDRLRCLGSTSKTCERSRGFWLQRSSKTPRYGSRKLLPRQAGRTVSLQAHPSIPPYPVVPSRCRASRLPADGTSWAVSSIHNMRHFRSSIHPAASSGIVIHHQSTVSTRPCRCQLPDQSHSATHQTSHWLALRPLLWTGLTMAPPSPTFLPVHPHLLVDASPVVLQTHCSNTHLLALPRDKPTRPLDISICWGSWLGR